MRTAPLLVLAFLFAGCSNTVTPSAVNPSVVQELSRVPGAKQPPPQGPSLVYVVSETAGQVSGFTATGGTLTPVAGSPFTTGGSPVGMVISYIFVTAATQYNYAYVVDTANNQVLGYSLNPNTGALTSLGPAFPAGTSPSGIAIDSTGMYVYVSNAGSNNVSAYAITPSTGALTQLASSPYSAGTTPNSIFYSPKGGFLYTTNGGSGNVSGWLVDSSTGNLTAITGSPFTAGGTPDAIATDYLARWAYVASSSNNKVYGYSVNSHGTLTALANSPYSGGTGPDGIATSYYGTDAIYVYVADGGTNKVRGFRAHTVGGPAGELFQLPNSPFNVQTGPMGENKRFNEPVLYVADNGTNHVSVKKIINSGRLLSVGAYAVPSGPVSMVSCVGVVVSTLNACRPSY